MNNYMPKSIGVQQALGYTPPMTDHGLLIALLLAIGAFGGFLSGLLGVGGGIIFVPALFFVLKSLGFDPDHLMHLSVGTSLAVIIATVLTSSRNHHKRGAVDVTILKSWGPFLVVGVLTGSYFAGQMDGKVLKELFAICTILIALYMAFGREKKTETVPAFLTLPVQRVFCFIIGIIASMTGMGGAVLTVPFMSYRGIPMQRAVGTGAALGVLVSIPGVIGYIFTGWPKMAELPPFSLGYVNLAAALILIAASTQTTRFGVALSHKLDRQLLRRLFAAVLTLVSLRMFLTL